MKRAASLQRRLGIGLAVAITAMWLAGTVVAGFVVRHELDEVFDSALMETAQRLLPLAVTDIMDHEDRANPAARRIPSVGPHEEYLTYLVRDHSGAVLMQSHDADPSAFPARPAQGFTTTATHRLYGEAAVSGTIFIEIAEPLAHRRTAAFETALGLFAPLPVLIPLSLVGVWWFVRRSLTPLRNFGREIETRGGGDLSPVCGDRLPTEIVPIGDAVNRLLARLQRVLEAERAFAANSAHELRTPIAATLAQTQRLIAETEDETLRGRARQIEIALRRLANISEKLMQLARAEGGGLLTPVPHDLAPILVHLMEEFCGRPDYGFRLRLTIPEDGTLRSCMDGDAFAILMRNLIENALIHGAPDSDVVIAASGNNTVTVVNGGPAVPSKTLAKLKGRFERGHTNAPGSGLGLAIADAIATGAGGRLELFSPARGKPDGFEAVLHLH